MGQALALLLPSPSQLLPHEFGGAARLDREVNKPSATESSFPTREKAEAQEQWRHFGQHVLLSDVVSPMDETREKSCSTLMDHT